MPQNQSAAVDPCGITIRCGELYGIQIWGEGSGYQVSGENFGIRIVLLSDRQQLFRGPFRVATIGDLFADALNRSDFDRIPFMAPFAAEIG
jgi:hypothetical protein